MKRFDVTGMSCAACSARVEKAVNRIEGVESCAVNLLTGSLSVEGNVDEQTIIDAVESEGYKIKIHVEKNRKEQDDSMPEVSALKKRLFISLIFLVVLMYFSMGHMIGLPMPEMMHGNSFEMGLVQLLITSVIVIINNKFFVNGFRSLFHRNPNMDTLVALGATAAYGYSIYVMITGNGDYYFESAGMILTLITLGKMLEAMSKGRTTDALKSLMKLAPQTAIILRDGTETEVSVDDVKVGDIFVVKPGEKIPVDGVVIDGFSSINESALTGESIPVDKAPGDSVSSGTINNSGYIRCEALKVGDDTTLSGIIKLVSDASSTKAPIAKAADKVSGIFVPVVILIAIFTTAVWLIIGKGVEFAIVRGIAVLVISCPCALGLATPVAVMVGNGMGAKNGILFKTAVSLEMTGKTQIAVLDKTGTITSGEPKVTDIIAEDEKELLALAFSLEGKSEHPLAKAVIDYCSECDIEQWEVSDFEALPGNGLCGNCNGHRINGGNLKYISSIANVPSEYSHKAEQLAKEGKTPLFFAKDGKFLGIISVADVIKEDSRKAVRELQSMGIRVVMLTGDNEQTAKAIGEQAGVDEVMAGVLPDGKEKAVRQFAEQGYVTMVGDGINDAPALTSADIGIAIGNGTDIAIDAADVVLMRNSLLDVPAAIRLSRATLRNIYENLFWAFIYNVIGIPLAAGAFVPMFGWELNPMYGAAAMSLSSFCVVMNALRINLAKIHNADKYRKKYKGKKKK